ncbi:ribonuclease H-like domain-containing protein [Tanacetum coccineum]
MDTGASSHLADNTCILTSFSNSSIYPSIFVGNGNSIPVTHTGHSFLHTSYKPLNLNHILVTPHIIKNLIYVRKFTRNNDVSVEFDAYGFSVKDYQTQKILLRCDSTGDLYPVTQQPSLQTPVVLLSFNSTTWHRRLGHPGKDVLRHLESSNLISCNKSKLFALFHSCQLDCSLNKYKARLVANGRSQQQGIDCDETFSLVVKPATIRTTVYMHQPPGFVDPNKPDYVCHLQRSLYGLKQASRAWFQRFASYATRVGFQHSKTDSSLFVFHRGSDIAYLLLYVDDIILTASSSAFL